MLNSLNSRTSALEFPLQTPQSSHELSSKRTSYTHSFLLASWERSLRNKITIKPLPFKTAKDDEEK